MDQRNSRVALLVGPVAGAGLLYIALLAGPHLALMPVTAAAPPVNALGCSKHGAPRYGGRLCGVCAPQQGFV